MEENEEDIQLNLDHNVAGETPRIRPSYAVAVSTSSPNSGSSIVQQSPSLLQLPSTYLSTLVPSPHTSNNTPDEVSDIIQIAASLKGKYKQDEQDSDFEKFYSFKCLICYKSQIPKQVILPCGHSQCCEECFKQMRKRYRRSRRYHLKTLEIESIRPGHDIHCPTCRQDGILCHLFLGEEDLTSELNSNSIYNHIHLDPSDD